MQEEEGSIGERFTMALARIVMLDWDQKLLKLARENDVSMLMYKRYVDDGNQGLRSLPLGARWSDEEMRIIVKEDLVELDISTPADQRSMPEIIQMGNSISPMIQL